MDPVAQRIQDDLRGAISGEVFCDDVTRAMYSTDASLFEVRPLGVVRPRTTEDVSAVVRYACENGIGVHARGAGTSLAGQSLGEGIVIDFSRFMRHILETRDEFVRVQPGVIDSHLEEHLGKIGRTLGPDPATATVTTIGGMIGRNTSGSRFLRHGDMRSRLTSARVVLADGTITEWGPTMPEVALESSETLVQPTNTTAKLAAALSVILSEEEQVLADVRSSGSYSSGGYCLDNLQDENGIHMERLLCGSEGTLALVTEATLLTSPMDRATVVGLFLFESLDRAAAAVTELVPLGVSACDLFDKRHLALARGVDSTFDRLIDAHYEACLLVEFTGEDTRECESLFAHAVEVVQGQGRLAIHHRRAETFAEKNLFWRLSRQVTPTLHGVQTTSRAVPLVEDSAIPPAVLAEFLVRYQNVLKSHSITATLFGHAGHGQMHVRPFIDTSDPESIGRVLQFADAFHEMVATLGGTIGAEQGCGISRTVHQSQYFPKVTRVFRRIKQACDPKDSLNPGKITDGEGLRNRARLRPEFLFQKESAQKAILAPAIAPVQILAVEGELVAERVQRSETNTFIEAERSATVSSTRLPLLLWGEDDPQSQSSQCNGCGACRSQSQGMRMCPIYRALPVEEASPRAKATLMAALQSGAMDFQNWESDAVKKVADLCVNCHQCRIDCAAGVDVPAIALELKAAHVAAHGLSMSQWFLSRVDLMSSLGGAMRPIANAMIANPQARWVLEKMCGVAQGRKLPKFSGNQFMRWATRRQLTRPSRRSGPRVFYFLDTFARWHDPLLAEAFVAVLEHNGIGVFIDPRQVSSGMPLVSAGDVDAARRVAKVNIRILSEAVRQGYTIVATEPSAVTCIKHDYPLLVDDEETDRVIAATTDAMSYLTQLHREGRLRLDFQPLSVSVLYHAPCHSRLHGDTSTEQLLRLIPGLSIQGNDHGCSGMAGTYGLAREHYRSSLRQGRALLTALRSSAVEAGATECSACRLQMEQGNTKPTIHPIKILAKAYGISSKFDGILNPSTARLVTS